MCTQNRETPLKTSLASWVPLINYYSVLSLLCLRRKYFLRALVLKLKFGEITEYLLLVLSKAKKKRATKILIIVALYLAAEKLTKDKKT